MNKTGLLAALAITIGVAYLAYPKTDRTSDTLTKINKTTAERDHGQPTGLDKLKSTARTAEPAAMLSAPKVVESARQEIQARPVAGAKGTVPTPTPVAVAPASTTPPANLVPALSSQPPLKAGVVPEAQSQAALDRLAAKVAAPAHALPAVPPGPASTQSSTLLLPSAATASAPVTGPGAAAPLPATSASVAPAADEPASDAGETKPEKKKPLSRNAGDSSRNKPRAPRFSSAPGRRSEGI